MREKATPINFKRLVCCMYSHNHSTPNYCHSMYFNEPVFAEKAVSIKTGITTFSLGNSQIKIRITLQLLHLHVCLPFVMNDLHETKPWYYICVAQLTEPLSSSKGYNTTRIQNQ